MYAIIISFFPHHHKSKPTRSSTSKSPTKKTPTHPPIQTQAERGGGSQVETTNSQKLTRQDKTQTEFRPGVLPEPTFSLIFDGLMGKLQARWTDPFSEVAPGVVEG